jgi:hypothetical protein
MKCKKIFINILESKDTIQEIKDVIESGSELQGYHIILENKTPDKFSCEFLVHSKLDIFWSIDMKKTVKTAQNIGVEEYKCKVELDKKDKKELIIWTNESTRIELKKIENHVLTAYIGDIDSIYLPASGTPVDIHFYQLFGYNKKYHFDQYRFLLIINLCNHATEADDEFVRESVEKIIRNSKEERKIEENTKAFYKLVMQNIFSENIGAYDTHKIYRSQILNRLAIDCEKNYQKRVERKVFNQPFQRNELLRTVANKTVQNDGFIVTEWNRKERFLIPQNTVIISQTKNWNIGEIERTLEKLVKSSPNHTYEIILYADHPNYIRGLEKIVENLFYNFDRLFKIKAIICGTRGKINLSEMQKLVVMTNFMNSVAPYFFLVAANSCFPANYMNYIEANYKEGDRMIVLRSANAIHLKTGHTSLYEANTNKLYEYYIECVFPVIEKNLFDRINYRILGDMNKIKDLKNFLMKNGTINGLRIVDFFDKNALHVFDS